jgi:hypothetical protein
MPARQAKLLSFWEYISCPFDDKKQEHGVSIKIIGFWVDISQGTISLPPPSAIDIGDKINTFLATPDRKPRLIDWQHLAGHLSWALNVLPWARPGLTEVYRKMSGKNLRFGKIFLNAEVTRDLLWFSAAITSSIGVRFIDSGIWDDSQADFVITTDASFSGFGISFDNEGLVYALRPNHTGEQVDIFFLELVVVLCAVDYVTSLPHPPRRLLLFCDNLDAVQVLNSLSTKQSIHNGPLLAIASLIMRSGIDLHVRHIPGELNVAADLLSRLLFADYHRQFPAHRVRTFSPSRTLLPARWQQTF